MSPSNDELWCSPYCSLTLASVTSFLDRDLGPFDDLRSPYWTFFVFVTWLTQSLHLTVLMEKILTNDILLKNTRSDTGFKPSMLTSPAYFLSLCSSLYRWHPISWWYPRGSDLGWSILYHYCKRGLHSSSPIWRMSGQAECWLTLWWWWSYPMASTLPCLSQPFCRYPPPQHIVRTLDHMVDTTHWWLQHLARPQAHGWFRETLSATI